MPGDSLREAFFEYLHALQQVLSCVSEVPLAFAASDQPDSAKFLLSIGGPDGSCRLTGEHGSYRLQLLQQYTMLPSSEEQWRGRVEAYAYTLLDVETGNEILAYHWHPSGSPIKLPHLHLGQEAGLSRKELQNARLPIGRITLQEFISLLVRELGVRAIRDDWEQLLESEPASGAGSSRST